MAPTDQVPSGSNGVRSCGAVVRIGARPTTFGAANFVIDGGYAVAGAAGAAGAGPAIAVAAAPSTAERFCRGALASDGAALPSPAGVAAGGVAAADFAAPGPGAAC